MRLLIFTSLISTFLFAQSNINDVLKKYEAYLFNLEQGMTDTSDVTSPVIDIDANGDLTVKDEKSIDTKIVLKVDGDRYYSLWESTKLETGITELEVELDYIRPDANDLNSIQSFSVTNDVLRAKLYSEVDLGGGDVIIINGNMTKNLLEPIFCGSNSVMNNIWDVDEGTRLNMKTTHNSKCDRKRTINELKALRAKLADIYFCDYTVQDGDCKDNMDMRFLLDNLL